MADPEEDLVSSLSDDDRDEGWSERPGEGEEDERLRREVPPHHGD